MEKSSEAEMSDSIVHQYASMVRESVEARKPERGLQNAIHDVARDYGLSARRVRGCLYGEVKLVEAAEWVQVRNRFLDYLEREAARFDARASLLRSRHAALRGKAS